MSPAVALAPRLAAARVRAGRGNGILDALAVLAFTMSAFLTLTVAGGTWMFVGRWQEPTDQILAALDIDTETADAILQTYVVLAAIACALLVIPVLNLGAAAARLGARGRERRLAALRLVGMSSRQVVVVSVIDTITQFVVGTVAGVGLWFATLPVWEAVSFQGQHIGSAELLLPWWLALALVAVLLVLAAVSTVAGLRGVRISPLGVAAQQAPKGLRARRAIAFIVAIVAFAVFAQVFAPNAGAVQLKSYAPMVAMILLVVGAVNLVGPWVLQLIARPGVTTGSPARLVAMRRIIDDPRGAWRNVSAVALAGMVAAYISVLPTDDRSLGNDPGTVTVTADLKTGALVTLSFGLIIAAVSTLISQAALVLDRSDEAISMDRAGMPRRLLASIRRRQVLAPLTITLVLSIGVGFLLAVPFMTVLTVQATGIIVVLATAAAGTVLTIGAAEACRPIERGILDHTRRPND